MIARRRSACRSLNGFAGDHAALLQSMPSERRQSIVGIEAIQDAAGLPHDLRRLGLIPRRDPVPAKVRRCAAVTGLSETVNFETWADVGRQNAQLVKVLDDEPPKLVRRSR